MDKIDIIAFMGWSVCMATLFDDVWVLIGCQAAYLAVYFIGRKLIDRWVSKTA